MSKPHEWFIEDGRFTGIAHSETGPGRYHVIEKSAYDELRAEVERLKNERKMLADVRDKAMMAAAIQMGEADSLRAEVERLKAELSRLSQAGGSVLAQSIELRNKADSLELLAEVQNEAAKELLACLSLLVRDTWQTSTLELRHRCERALAKADGRDI